MAFEFDPGKSIINEKKHGVDFVEIQRLWEDPKHLVVPARSSTEERYAIIGEIFGKVWVCIFTPRGTKLRIISARRARDEEKAAYNHR